MVKINLDIDEKQDLGNISVGDCFVIDGKVYMFVDTENDDNTYYNSNLICLQTGFGLFNNDLTDEFSSLVGNFDDSVYQSNVIDFIKWIANDQPNTVKRVKELKVIL